MMKIFHVYIFVSLILFSFGCKEDPLCDFPRDIQVPSGYQITKLASINNTSEYFHLQFTDENNGFMLGNDTTLLKTKDGGHSWTKTPITDSFQIKNLWFLDSLNGYASFYSEKNTLLSKTIDGGQTWETIKYSLEGNITHLLHKDENLFAILRKGERYQLIKSTDQAITWDKINDFTFDNTSIFTQKDDKIFIVGYPYILVCNTAGHLLKKIDISISLISSFYVFDNKTMIIGNNSKIFKSNDFGDHWTNISQAKESQQIIHFFNKDNGIVLTGEDCSLSDSYIVAYAIGETTTSGAQWVTGEYFDPSNFSYEVDVALKDENHIVILEEREENKIVLHEIQKK